MRYRILGVTEAADDHGTAIPIPGPRLRTLLAALALRPARVIPPTTLIDEIWADAPPQDAPAALQALIGRLRRTLGKHAITSTPGGYRLAATEDDVDLYVFERLVHEGTAAVTADDAAHAARVLTEALALWRGPALADLPDRTAATRADALHLEATRARIDAELRLGRAHTVVPRLTELTTAHPYDEPLHALLIRALRDTGRGADALAAYETARRALSEGLGTDPGPQLRALHAELLTEPPQPTAPSNSTEEPRSARSATPEGAGAASRGFAEGAGAASRGSAEGARSPSPGSPGSSRATASGAAEVGRPGASRPLEDRSAANARPAEDSWPETPGSEVPRFQVPGSEAPRFQVPECETSSFGVPEFEASSFGVPGVEAERSQDPGSAEGSRCQAPGSAEVSRCQAPGSAEVSRSQTPGSAEALPFQAPGSVESSRPQDPGSAHDSRPSAPGAARSVRPQPAGSGESFLSRSSSEFSKHSEPSERSAPSHPQPPCLTDQPNSRPHPHDPAGTIHPHRDPAPLTDPHPHSPAATTHPHHNPTPLTPTPGPRPQPPTRTGNIRPRLTSFVGREPELVAIRSELHRARLVTLTGPGGSGKTRLAEEAAAGLPQAWLVELAPLDRPEAVPGAVVNALGLRETVLMTTELTAPQDDPVALLVEHCAPRSQLLILDNCEHVIEAVAALAETLLTRCPGLTILATSREPLGVPGESVRPVEPLVPDQAHRLFEERASAVRPDAAAVLRDREAVQEICRRLDGLPLAIELAAARLRLLTPRQIADRLDDRFRLLTSGSRTVLPRQQTLRAVVDWSWELLDERERTVLREVSVFTGGWDITAAEAVCPGPAADLVGALVDKSLIVATPYETPYEEGGSGTMRYRMLETIHEYAVERAAEIPELRAKAERRHRAWVRALVAEAEPRLRSADQLPWIHRLETELDNIRAALDRALDAGAEEEAGALALDMGWFWWLRNYRQEGMAWVDRTLRLGVTLDGQPTATTRDPCPPTTPDPIDAFLDAPDGERQHPRHPLRMNLRMLHLFLRADSERFEDRLDERLRSYVARLRDFYAPGGPEAARMPGLVWPLATYVLDGSVDVRDAMEAAVANSRRYGDDWAIGVVLMFRTHMAVDSPGGMKGVDEDLAELRVLSRRVGDRWMRAQVCSASAEAAMARSRHAEAKAEYEEALRLAYEVGAYAETPFLLARLAEIAYRAGDRQAARRLLDEASEAAERHAVVDSAAFVLLTRAQMALDEKDTARARQLWEEAREETGRGTPPPQFLVMLMAVDAGVTAAESGPAHGLSKLVDAVREAVEKRCADMIVATLLDGTAGLLAELGDHARVVRLLALADTWRDGQPRLMPEGARAEAAGEAARVALGAERHETEYARGAALTPAALFAEFTETLRRHPAR